MPGKKQNWYAVYTKPRWEKKVHALLEKEGMEAYCPMNKVRRQWSDRIKWIEEPLFKSYVFVKVTVEEQTQVRMVGGVVNFVYWLGKPARIPDKEINIIRKFLNEYDDVQAIPLDLRTDDRITIKKGALMDKEAKIVRVFNNKVQVIIESVGYSLVAVLNKSNVVISGKQ